jgi:hypothetical protein
LLTHPKNGVSSREFLRLNVGNYRE